MKALLANPLKAGRFALFAAGGGIAALIASLPDIPFVPFSALGAVVLWSLLGLAATVTGVAGLRTRAGRIGLALVVLSIPLAWIVGLYHEHQADTFGGAEVLTQERAAELGLLDRNDRTPQRP